jgi:predicted GNAT family acetyltransferase
MEKVTLELNEKGHGAFLLKNSTGKLGEMVVGITGKVMTVYHTEVSPQQEGKGLSKLLLDAMADHATKEGLQVKPLCSYVATQFKRHPETYAAIWSKDTIHP